MGDRGTANDDIMAKGFDLLHARYEQLGLVMRILCSMDDDQLSDDAELLQQAYNVVNHFGLHVPSAELLRALWQV